MRTTACRLVLLALLVAAPASAYTVYLKDGSTIISVDKYVVEGRRAIITMPSGTKTFIALAEIDIERTDRENTINYGDAKVVGADGTVTTLVQDEPPPPPKATLQTLAQRRTETPPPATQQQRRQTVQPASSIVRTPSGSVDLSKLPGAPFANLDISAEVGRLLASRNLEGLSLYQGSQANRILVEVTTNSEAAVFNALQGTARALTQIRESRGNAVGAIELLMRTQRRQLAGQFTLTPELAAELLAAGPDVSTFFVRHVEF